MRSDCEVEVVTIAFILAILGLIAALTNSVVAGLAAAFGFAAIFNCVVALARASYKYTLIAGAMLAVALKSSGAASDWEGAILLAIIVSVALGAIVWFQQCAKAINSGAKVR